MAPGEFIPGWLIIPAARGLRLAEIEREKSLSIRLGERLRT
jgi:hypothetical protein